MALDGILLDVDGTLFDTNEQHARAWTIVLEEHGYTIGKDRILLEIGKGGDRLVPSVLGAELAEKDGKAMRDRHGDVFRSIIDKEGVEPFAGVEKLFASLRKRGIKTAVATAAKKENLQRMVKVAGLDLFKLADVVVTDSDVEESKPAPDVVTAAYRKLGMSPAQCAMIGDTPYDAQACLGAGVVCIGVVTGIQSEEALRNAGCRLTYRDAADLEAHLDEALQACSPAEVHFDQEQLEAWMRSALEVAKLGPVERELPIGAVVVDAKGEILSRAFNEVRQRRTPVAHAEIVALERLPSHPARRSGLTLVTTLEPCVMCFGACMEAGIDTIVYALEAPANGGPSRCRSIDTPGAVRPRVVKGILRDESRALLEAGLDEYPDKRYLKDLLERTA